MVSILTANRVSLTTELYRVVFTDAKCFHLKSVYGYSYYFHEICNADHLYTKSGTLMMLIDEFMV